MYKLKTFDEFVLKGCPIDESLSLLNDYGNINELNESHTHFNNVSSVLDKVNTYTLRRHKIYRSNISESLKRKLDKDVEFTESEKIGVDIIFTEMVRQYGESIKEEIAYYDKIISGNEELINEVLNFASTSDELLVEGLFKKLSDGAKKLGQKTKEVMGKGKEKVSNAVDKIKSWAQELKSQLEERFLGLVRVVKTILKNAGNSVKDFIKATFEVFSKIAEECDGLFSKVIEKLGGTKMDKEESMVKVDVKDIDPYKGIDNKEQKCFLSYVMSETLYRWKEYAKTTDEFSGSVKESKSAEIDADEEIKEISKEEGKLKQFLKSFGTQIKTLNFWKSILISLSVSVFMFILPHILIGVVGLSCPIAMFIVAFINCAWSWRNFFKFIKKRRAQMKAEGKSGIKSFFSSKTTCVFFTLSVLSVGLSTFNVINTFGPFMAEICKILKIDNNSEGLAGILYKIAKGTNPEGTFVESSQEKWTEEIHHGVKAEGTDLNKNVEMAGEKLQDAGISGSTYDNTMNHLKSGADAHGSMGVIGAQKAAETGDMVAGGTFDFSHVKDATEKTAQAFDKAVQQGIFGPDTILVQSGSQDLVNKTIQKGGEIIGDNITILNATPDQLAQFQQLCINDFGISKSQAYMSTFGSVTFGGDTITHMISTAAQWNVPVPSMLFTPLFIPFFDKSLDGKFKMRFSSATRGYPAYVVSTKKTEMVDTEKLKEISGDSPAVNKLITIHDNIWKESKALLEDNKSVNESKKDKKKNEPKIEEPEFVVIYVNVNENTGNDKDTENGKERKKKDDIQPGIVIDTLSMMCADICPFNKSRRSQPYYMKGLLSRLSFRPTKDRDNKVKNLIRELLAKTMQTAIVQSAKFGVGQKYVKLDDSDKKNPKFVVVEKASSEIAEIGNLTPQEMVDCLNDDSKNNKKCYDLLDGRFATKLTMKTDDNGNIKITAKKDSSAIEFVKYYKVSDDEKKHLMGKYEENLKKFENGKRKTKPSKPKFKTVEINGETITYKQLSKATEKRLKLKSDEIFDFVDIKIIPLLSDKESDVYKELNDDKNIKKLLYKNDELNLDLIKVLKPFLFRPEKTFSQSDDYALDTIINSIEDGENKNDKKGLVSKLLDKLKWSSEKVHDTFKNIVEIIWDNLSDSVRSKMGKAVDGRKKKEDVSESFESLFDRLVEEFLDTNEVDETMYDELIVEMREGVNKPITRIQKFNEFISKYY